MAAVSAKPTLGVQSANLVLSRGGKFSDVAPGIRARMSRIRKIDTKPEMIVRRLTHQLGYRFRTHRRDLPGTPDLVFPSRRKIIFVHGCFWHRHACSNAGKIPQTRAEYWGPKLRRNVERDVAAYSDLAASGWEILTVWECEVSRDDLAERLRSFLGAPSNIRSTI